MQEAGTKRQIYLMGYAACALANCLWGTGFYFGRLALREMSVEYMVLYRFSFACLVMLPLVALQAKRIRFSAADCRRLFLTAFLGIAVQFLVQFHGLARTTVSHAALMVGSLPVLLAATATLFGGERLDRFGWSALWISTFGAVLVSFSGGQASKAEGSPTLTGDLLVIASLFASLAWIMLSKDLMQRHRPDEVTSLSILLGTFLLALWTLGPWLLQPILPGFHSVAAPPFAQITATAWMALAASGLLCSATTTLLWNWGIHHIPASRASIFINIEPVLGTILGVALLGERPGMIAWAGGALILGSAIAQTLLKPTPEPLQYPE